MKIYYGTPLYTTEIDITDEQISVMKKFFETRHQYVDNKSMLYTGDLNYRPGDTQILSMSEFECLKKPINNAIGEYLSALTQQTDEFESYITKSWPVIIKHTGQINMHHHKNSHLSVIYYLSDVDPEHEGNLTFARSDNHDLLKIGLGSNDLNTSLSGRYVSIEAKKNRLVIFPSSLRHFVTEYLGEDPRYSVSCDVLNVKVKGDLENRLTNPHSWVKLCQ